MRALGEFLVVEDAPAKSGGIVVLGGDPFGRRIVKAAELVRQGLAPAVVVSGPPGWYGRNESELAIAYAVKQGYPSGMFIPAPNNASSTREEVDELVPKLRELKMRTVLVVTNDFHTRRARRLWRARAAEFQPRIVSCPDEFYRPHAWWQTRQSRKTFFFEWSKTVAEALGV